MSLTQVRELDREILMKMDDLTLGQACQASRWIHQICSDDFFWRERLQRRFGDKIAALKKPEESYHQMYIRLTDLYYSENQVWISADEGHLDELMLLAEAGIPINQEDFVGAAQAGYLDVIQWLLSYPDVNPSFLMKEAIRGNQWELVQWLNQHYAGLITPDVANWIFRKRGPQMLDWLADRGV